MSHAPLDVATIDDATPLVAATGARVAAGVGGAVLVAVALVITAGFALAGFVGLGIAALVLRRRARPYTPFVGWASAVGTASLALLAIMAFAIGQVPRDTFQQIQSQVAVAAQHPPPPTAVDSTIERMYPGATAANRAQTQAITRALGRSPGMVWWIIAIGVVLGVLTFGAFVGSVAWGSATVLLFGVLGRWPSTRRPQHAYVYESVHDAFDDI